MTGSRSLGLVSLFFAVSVYSRTTLDVFILLFREQTLVVSNHNNIHCCMNQRWIIWLWTYKDKYMMMNETCEANNISHYHNECPNNFPINVSQWRNGLSWNRLPHSMQWFRSLCPMKCDGNIFLNQYTGPNHLPMCCPTIPEQTILQFRPYIIIYPNFGKTQFPVISCVCPWWKTYWFFFSHIFSPIFPGISQKTVGFAGLDAIIIHNPHMSNSFTFSMWISNNINIWGVLDP